MVGEAEQIIGAQPRLDVFVGHIVKPLALRRGMADIAEHLVGGGADIDLGAGDAECLYQAPGVRLRLGARREAGQRIGEHIAARQAEPVHHPRRDDQRLRRIEPARDADHQLLEAGRGEPLRQPLDLDVVGLVAIIGEHRRIGRHEREALDRAA